ncbi:hypothetical protein [Cupriavidus basilensis]|uniref:hypothetical protein n=1 Tax=Cupriavidus basilensis TaxID=68895 RepID=UPI000750DC3D|nr:hypothetical protein [Cupriavidus basilensis]
MLTRLPTTRELLDALKRKPSSPSDTPAPRHAGLDPARLQRGLFGLFWGCSLAALLVAGAVLYARARHQAPAPWLLRLLYCLLAGSVAGLGGVLLSHAPALARRLRDPLGPLAEQIDRPDDAESALLRALARIPAQALRARGRRVELHLRMWEGMAKIAALLVAVSPLALMLVTGLLELPRKGASLVPLLSLYGVAFVAGAALVVFLQLQVARPLRRLAYVLAEAAEISAQLGRAAVPAGAATARGVPVAAVRTAVPSPAPVPPDSVDGLDSLDRQEEGPASPDQAASQAIDHVDGPAIDQATGQVDDQATR